jgi:NAD(P)-dependent dehydrogenase (short-subunit alcohol dehydrogenase family)
VVANTRAIKPSEDPDVLAVEGDISQPATADRITGDALARFGRIDTLVNNAGVFVSKPFTDYTAQDHALIGRRQPHRVLLADPARHRRDAEAERRPRRQRQRHPGR